MFSAHSTKTLISSAVVAPSSEDRASDSQSSVSENCPSLSSYTSTLRFAGHLDARQDVVTECLTLMPLVSKDDAVRSCPALFASLRASSRSAGSSCYQQRQTSLRQEAASATILRQITANCATTACMRVTLTEGSPSYVSTLARSDLPRHCKILRFDAGIQRLATVLHHILCRVRLVRGHAHDLCRIQSRRDRSREARTRQIFD